MSVDDATVRKIARLARIGVRRLRNSLRWRPNCRAFWAGSSSLGEVDTQGVAPMTAVIPAHLKWRDDVVTDGGVREKVLANAPDSESGFFAVPKVIE